MTVGVRRCGGQTVTVTIGAERLCLTASQREDGSLGEVFIRWGKYGTSGAGLLDTYAAGLAPPPLPPSRASSAARDRRPPGRLTGQGRPIRRRKFLADFVASLTPCQGSVSCSRRRPGGMCTRNSPGEAGPAMSLSSYRRTGWPPR